MTIKKRLKNRIKKTFFRSFFVLISIFSLISFVELGVRSVYAEPEGNLPESSVVSPGLNGAEELVEASETSEATPVNNISNGESCKKSLGAIGWLVCPTTGKIAEAVDWLYEKIEDILVISPIHAENGSPIYEIWKYLRGITNIVFIIFLLVVIYSQITGLGINNYGIKKVLPKLIIAAVLVNFSFLICQVLVDVSNVVGDGLRGVFTSISEVAIPAGSGVSHTSYAEMYSAIGGMTAAGIGAGIVAVETGAIWMLIPVVLGALVAVVSGLITIALRQAVVALLIMISPLAMVAFILPNTEKWFTKWRDLLFKMLVFYPMFSLLFGASQLAGFAIIASAKNGFGMLLGMAVEIFPLFFSWSLMKMSGTFLNTINAKLNALAARPLAATQTWADSHRQLTKAKFLASGRPLTPTLRLMQFSSNRKIAREAEIKEKGEIISGRGMAYKARRNYVRGNVDGVLSKEGEEGYADQARMMEYKRVVERDKNNFNKGFGYRAKEGTATRARLDALDKMNVNASDMLKVEQARGEKIDYENAVGFHKRMEGAINAHMDLENGFRMKDGVKTLRNDYKFHFDSNNLEKTEELARYNAAKQIMEGNVQDVQYAAASAAQAYDTQKKIVETKMQKYFELAPPTKDVVYRLTELTNNSDAIANIDAIISGLRILNQRGDTDLLRHQMRNVLDQGLEVGTHASQSLASFLMFEVKDNDPWLRRFGKYINLETANAFDANKRQEMKITYDEYIKGYHMEPNGKMMYAKRPMAVLMEGTSLDNVERTAFDNFDESLMEAYSYIGDDGEKHLNVEQYLKKRNEVQASIGPQFISASLKYLSGSEQLKSAVKFLTGYSYSQMKDKDGNVILDNNGDVMYEWKARWGKDGDLTDDPKRAEKYFEDKALQYFKDQTPTQILGLRSDYRDPLMEHLSKSLSRDSEANEEYEKKKSEIQTRYADLPAEEAEKKRKIDLKKLKMEMAGKQVRKILGESGKLEQIYRTRRSGAANNAKDWLREWVNLDNESALHDEVVFYRNKQRREWEEEMKKRKAADPSIEYEPSMRIYNENDQMRFEAAMSDLNDDYKDEDTETYFKLTRDQLNEWFPNDFAVWSYEKFYENNSYATNDDLYSWLKEFLEDLDRYPGNRDKKE